VDLAQTARLRDNQHQVSRYTEEPMKADQRKGTARRMPTRFATPRQLVESLQQGRPGAREDLAAWLSGPIGQLMDRMRERDGLQVDRTLSIRCALHAVELYLRERSVALFSRETWASFQGTLLIHVAKMASLHRLGLVATDPTGPGPLPDHPLYESQTFFRPYETLGGFRFGGDWFGGLHADDGSLWIMVADITGHDYYAYLLARSLADLWRLSWQTVISQSPEPEPVHVLRAMHELLLGSLPEGFYVEATLARFRGDGEARVAPGGGSRILVRSGSTEISLHRLRGGWLGGWRRPEPEDQQNWVLEEGDELLLCTDGVYDQLEEQGIPATEVAGHLHDLGNGGTLFDAIYRVLEESLRQRPQADDITMILLRRRKKTG
jgi:hypothetical protein